MEYLAVTRAAQPYQGYAGPGWYGHVMVPLPHAFAVSSSEMLAGVEPAMIERIIHSSELFNDDMRAIPSKAEHIQRELNRSVWNGNLKLKESSQRGASADAAGFSKTLLTEISNTGAKTKNVFQSSIADLNKTVVTSLLHDNQFHAALAIDIMDRNLYERANDCRWWALTAAFAELLSAPSLSDTHRADDPRHSADDQRALHGLFEFDRIRPRWPHHRGLGAKTAAISKAPCSTKNGSRASWRCAATRPMRCRLSSRRISTKIGRLTSTARRLPTRSATMSSAVSPSSSIPSRNSPPCWSTPCPATAPAPSSAAPSECWSSRKAGSFPVPTTICAPASESHIDPAFLHLAPGSGHFGFTAVGKNYYAVGAQSFIRLPGIQRLGRRLSQHRCRPDFHAALRRRRASRRDRA